MIKKWSLLKTLLSILSWLLFLWYGGATTIFSPGDIFITTININPDYIQFVSRIDITTGTTVYFTDNAQSSTWAWLMNEWSLSITANKIIPAGTIISIHGAESTTPANTYILPAWLATITRNPNSAASFNLATDGDQIIIYQWTMLSDPNPSFIYGISVGIASWWITSGIPTANTSYLPANLTLWIHAFSYTPASHKSIQYSCSNRDMTDPNFWINLYTTSCWSWNTSWWYYLPLTWSFIANLAPIVTLSWLSSLTLERWTPWIDPGASWSDDVDVNWSIWSATSWSLDLNLVWTYTLEYTYIDSLWLTWNIVTRIITIIDTPPTVTLNWSETITIPRSSGYIEQWAVWSDFVDGSGSITTPTIISWPNTWSVDTYGMPWSYTLEYVYIDTAGNTGSATRTVIVQNPWVPDPQDDAYTMYQDTSLDLTIPPQVIVANDNNMEYTTSWGLVTGPTNGTIIMTGQWFIYTPNTGFVWNDTFIYELCNILNQCDSALVTITIIDTQSPLLTLSGSSTETIEAGIPWVDPGYICTDATACTVVTTGMVNSSLPWTYTLIYTATDTEWNFTTVTRTVIVIDTTAPVIVLNGSTSLTLTQWTAFSDSGASWTDSVDGSGVVALPTSWSVNINIPWIYTLEYTYTDSAGNNGNIVTRTVTVQAISSATGTISTWSSWWWGGWYILQKDNCPDWDHSPTHYDGVCKWDNEPVDEQTFNPSIWSTCFKPLNKKTIDQGIKVSEAFKTAHQMLYSYQLTKRQGTRDYRPFDYLTREEAARFMVEFAQNVLCRKPTRSYNNNFSDINTANPTLTKFIRESYNYGIFNGNSDGTFRPNDRITNDELSAIMVRLVTNSILDEPEWDRAAQYRSTLSQYAQISILNNEGRWNIAEVIYDLYRNNKYKLTDMWYIIQ